MLRICLQSKGRKYKKKKLIRYRMVQYCDEHHLNGGYRGDKRQVSVFSSSTFSKIKFRAIGRMVTLPTVSVCVLYLILQYPIEYLSILNYIITCPPIVLFVKLFAMFNCRFTVFCDLFNNQISCKRQKYGYIIDGFILSLIT